MDATPMDAALEVAAGARGRTSPNPWVGAAVVLHGRVIAVGATEPPPGRHAEAVALDAAGDLARGSHVYVTLEPCAPFEGKRTKPCSERLIEAGVAEVTVALTDPDDRVSGLGIRRLREAGITVHIEQDRRASDLLRPYIKHRRSAMPYVIAKFAASLDGRTATRTGDSKWITGDAARDLGHRQRAWVDAVLVGSGTVLADDPSLTARPGGVLSEHQPVRIVVDARGRTPPDAALVAQPGSVIIATTRQADPAWRAAVASGGVQVIDCEPGDPGVNLRQLLQVLAARGIMSIWAEGGGTLLGALFDEDLVDEVWAFIAPVVIGGRDALPAVGGEGALTMSGAWRLTEPHVELTGGDVLVRGYLKDLL
jgi:diaminohydroxyphosphoribosylaminopyrimidine deaminase/5-amino-6-(5-phosphoribosylamino)uracil reductase